VPGAGKGAGYRKPLDRHGTVCGVNRAEGWSQENAENARELTEIKELKPSLSDPSACAPNHPPVRSQSHGPCFQES
jgi:hypothetical protein